MNKEYWTKWLQKFFSIPISFSAWCVFWLFYFRAHNWIDDIAFTTGLGIILGQRVYKDVKEFANNKGGNNENNSTSN